jgi:hypothetical protein
MNDPAAEKVHLRRSDEPGDKGALRPAVNVLRSIDLVNAALPHDHHPVAQRQGFHLIMGDIDDGTPQLLVDALQLQPHAGPEAGIEVAQRLVQQEEVRPAHDGPAHGHALPLAAGELPGFAVQQFSIPSSRAASSTLRRISALGTRRMRRPKPMFSATVM